MDGVGEDGDGPEGEGGADPGVGDGEAEPGDAGDETEGDDGGQDRRGPVVGAQEGRHDERDEADFGEGERLEVEGCGHDGDEHDVTDGDGAGCAEGDPGGGDGETDEGAEDVGEQVEAGDDDATSDGADGLEARRRDEASVHRERLRVEVGA